MSKGDVKKESSEGEDIPSDFFDDFCKDDFMEVIDSWNDETKDTHASVNEKTLENVNDLRELIPNENRQHSHTDEIRLNQYIQPGSRRDPNKTKQAIKRDKEVKVKELLAKHLESMDDIRPPGTELDDYFDESRNSEKKKFAEEVTRKHMNEKQLQSPSPLKHAVERRKESSRNHHESPLRKRRISPSRHRRESPLRFRRASPKHHRASPTRSRREYSPKRREIRGVRVRGHNRFSPSNTIRRPHVLQRTPRRSPKRHRSPETRRERRSRSPYKRFKSRSPISLSPRQESKDREDKYSFPASQYVQNAELAYQQQQESFATYPDSYYPPEDVPQPVPAPTNSMSAPNIVPSPYHTSSGNPQILDADLTTQCDALAKLVADGKLSHEDYLKLAPIKGATPNLDPKERVAVLNRCRIAMENLCKLGLPNHLLMNTRITAQDEQKTLIPVKKFRSPLKRRTAVEFHFSKNSKSLMEQRNKEIIDSIISALSLEKIVAKPKKTLRKDMKDASVQTTMPVCDVCDIRESTKFSDMSTSMDPAYFSSSVHTQVIEEDLYSSKSLFNPSGGSSSSAPISIAHLTPAQLVSQLAARAKTLKHTDTSQSAPGRNFDNYHRGGNYQNSNYNNYRY